MRRILGIIITIIVVIIIAVVVVTCVANDENNPLSDAASDVENTAANAILDTTGLKSQIKDLITSHSSEIAQYTGLSEPQIESAIDELNIDDWEVVSLPSNAVVASTIDGSDYGVDGTITTYDDPNYITVSAYGQEVTLEVPESAQAYLSFLA